MEALANALGKSKPYITKVLKVLSLEDEIINDLRINKSVKDIESLYEIQKIEDPKEQVRVYFSFISKELDRKGLRALNKAKCEVSHAKQIYRFSNREKTVKVEFDRSKLSDEKIRSITKKFEEVLNTLL